jgi:phosphatidylcholine synthase
LARFLGFPAVWNVVVFYIVVFLPPFWLALSIVMALAAMMFLPVVFVHPVRVKRWRPMTMAMLAMWSVAAVWSIIVDRLAPGLVIKALLLAGGIYFLGLGFLRDLPEKE